MHRKQLFLPEAVRAFIDQVYLPHRPKVLWRFEEFIGHDRIHYVSYARDALRVLLGGIGVRHGDQVLIPEFICSDIIDAVRGLGGVPAYYPVDKSLRPIGPVELFPSAKAILAVNYFGFPQDLSPFRQYCRLHGSLLIEDNAHGLLSRDTEGRPLGTRGDVGLFSLRKTLPVQDGAALVVNNSGLSERIGFPEMSGALPASQRWKAKCLARALMPVLGVRGVRSIIAAGRIVRDMLPTGDTKNQTGGREVSWHALSPYADFKRDLGRTDVVEEARRRRGLYHWLQEVLHDAPITPVFGELDAYTVPYGYPFHAEPEVIPQIRGLLAGFGLDCFSWPDLPDSVRAGTPDWYSNIWCVQFLW